MVEGDHAVVEREVQIGQPAVVGRRVGQPLGVAHRVVAGIADRSAEEADLLGQAGGLADRLVLGHQLGEHFERVGDRADLGLERGRRVGERPAADRDLVPALLGRRPGGDFQKRVGAGEAVAADVVADDAFEQKARVPPAKPVEGRDRRERVGDEPAGDGYELPLPFGDSRQGEVFVERRKAGDRHRATGGRKGSVRAGRAG